MMPLLERKEKKAKGFSWHIRIEFQDILAMGIVLPFLYFTTQVLFLGHDLEVLRLYVPLMSIILGGYFGQGVVREWHRSEYEYKSGEMVFREGSNDARKPSI